MIKCQKALHPKKGRQLKTKHSIRMDSCNYRQTSYPLPPLQAASDSMSWYSRVGGESSVFYTVEPLYKGTGPLSLIQWSLSTRDKLAFVPYTVEPLYKGQVGLCPLQWSLSTRDKLGSTGPLSLIQWSLSTRDKLGTGPLSLIQWSLSTTKGQVGDGSFVPYTVEPLYKGQVGDGSFVPYTVEPLYKGQVGDGSGHLFRDIITTSFLISSIHTYVHELVDSSCTEHIIQ